MLRMQRIKAGISEKEYDYSLFRVDNRIVIVLIVAVVVLKAWRIANENPVKSIKSE
ncbi:hypothetical protein [uncultured Bacteroides sp.]|nr:hypothetical protein [uncultured Bacteroides sp.]